MNTIKTLGVGNIAEYLGINATAVYQLINRHGPDTGSNTPMPEPAVKVVQTKKTKNGRGSATYGWLTEQLPDIRTWYASEIKGWDELTAAHHWIEVDATLKRKEHDASGT